MTISSTWWGALIAFGAVLAALGAILAAIGNVNLSAARDRERAVAASEKAMSMLKSECTDNLAHLTRIRQALANGQIPVEPFETTAWDIVLNGGLLAQVDGQTLGKLTEIYHLIGLAERQQTQLVELATGPPIA
jgi:hypothetical protein